MSGSGTQLPNKHTLAIIIALIIVGVGWFVYRAIVITSDSGEIYSDYESSIAGVFEIEGTMPQFEAYDFAGNHVSSADFAGKPVIYDFWAGWCVFCRDEMPILERIHQEYGDEIQIVGIHRTDTGETLERAIQFASEQGTTYQMIQDPSGAIYKAVAKGLTAMPVAVFVTADGIVQDIRFGPKSEEDMRESIEKLQ